MSDQNNLKLNGSNQEERSIGTEWHCQFCKVSKAKAHEDHEPPIWWRIGSKDYSETQKWLAKKIECRSVHLMIIILIFLDLCLILTDLSLSSFYPIEEEAPDAVHTVQNVFAWTSVGILSIFTLEQIAKLIVFGPQYFFKFWHALDAFIIIASLVLEIVLRQNQDAREVASLLIIFRLWRLVRIMHGIVEEVTVENEERMKNHHRLEKKMQMRINELELQLNLPPSPPMTLNGKKSKNNLTSNSDENILLHTDPHDII
jgi:hypothetical protein